MLIFLSTFSNLPQNELYQCLFALTLLVMRRMKSPSCGRNSLFSLFLRIPFTVGYVVKDFRQESPVCVTDAYIAHLGNLGWRLDRPHDLEY